MPTFAVFLERFSRWDPRRDLREQDGFEAHARFMDDLVDAGFVVLGGPLADRIHVLLIVEAADAAAVERRLAQDPWWGTHLRLDRIEAWDVMLRAAPAP